MLIINLQFFPFRNQIYKENCTRNSPHTIRNSTIPIQKEDWKSKNKKEKQEKSPATAIPLYCLRQLFVSKLNVLCSFNCLQHNTNNFVDYQTKEPKKKKTLRLIISSTGRPKTRAILFLLPLPLLLVFFFFWVQRLCCTQSTKFTH